MSNDYAIEVYNKAAADEPTLSDPGDANAWEAWRGGEEAKAAIEWRTDAMSSLKLFPAKPGADGLPDQPIGGEGSTVQLLNEFAQLAPRILRQTDITGRVLITYQQSPPEGASNWWAGRANLATVEGSTWKVKTSSTREVTIDVAQSGQTAVLAWRPDAEHPWYAQSWVKDAFVLITAAQALSKSIKSTANSRAALRDVIVAVRRAQAALVTPSSAPGSTQRMSVREMYRQLMAQIKDGDKASAAVGALIEVDDVDEVKTLSLSGSFDTRVVSLRDLAIQAIARSAPVPPQVVLGTENSNHWSSDVAYAQALQVYLAADARFIAEIAAAAVGAVTGTDDLYVGWAFDGLDPDSWRTALAAELDLDLASVPSEQVLRAILLTRAMLGNRPLDEATAYVDAIITAYKDDERARAQSTAATGQAARV